MNAPSTSFDARHCAARQTPTHPGTGLFAVLLGCLALLPSLASAQSYTSTGELYTETSSIFGDPNSDERFGYMVAASNDTIVVGTPAGPQHGPYHGYVFARGATGWTLQQKLAFPTGNVAVDGDTLVGGGDVYVRSGGTWTLQQSINNYERPQAALQGDTLVIGNPFDRTQDNGSVAIWVRNGSTWTLQGSFGPDTAHEMLGGSVAVDGDTALAGIGNGTGGAYVYVRTGTTWTRQTRLVVPTSNSTDMKVALEGDTAAVSDRINSKVYIFTRSGTTWTLTQTLAQPATGFGLTLTMKGGILGGGGGLSFYMYGRTSSGWVLAQSMNGSMFDASQVALGDHGRFLVVGDMLDDTGATNAGRVVIFSNPPPPAPGSGWRDADLGAVGLAGSSTVNGAEVQVSGSGADIWGTADQFHFRSESLTGDGAIIARVNSAGSGTAWAKVGLMFRENLAPASRTVMALVTPGGHVGLQARTAPADNTSFVDGWADAPIWLMLSRTGDHFDAFRSDDGSSWTPIGSATVSMPATIHVGLAVSSHDNSALNTGTFSGIELVGSTPPPPPDTLAGSDLGSVAVAGTFTDASGSLTIDAAGADLWDQADSGYFIHREITGDFDLRARVASLTNTHAWAKAGVMVRESLDAGSRNLFTMISADAASGLQVRDTTGGSTTFSSGPWVHAPYWVRLVRTGDSFQSFISADGTTWQSVGTQTLALPATLHAGVAVSSHVANTTAHATIDSFELVGGTPPPPPDTLAGSDLGSVAVAGTFTNTSGSLTIDAAGADLWDQADSGYFIHQTITGDFDIHARVASLTNTHAWAKAGLMVRESLDAGSRNLFTMISADAASGLQVRDTTGGTTTFSSGPWVHAPYWVRLVRTGNSFQAYVSENGTTWLSVGTQTLALPATLEAGIAVSSHVASTTTHVTVDSLQFGD